MCATEIIVMQGFTHGEVTRSKNWTRRSLGNDIAYRRTSSFACCKRYSILSMVLATTLRLLFTTIHKFIHFFRSIKMAKTSSSSLPGTRAAPLVICNTVRDWLILDT